MPTINKVRYEYVRSKISEFITDQEINKLPINPIQIIDKNKWSLRTYSFYAQKHKTTPEDVAEAYGSKDAFTVYENGLYSIAYNDKVFPPERARFSLMHEVGHIYLKHLEEFEQTILARGGLTDEEYKILESEANIFAADVLAPVEVLIALGWTNYRVIKQQCKLSKRAAESKASLIFDLLFNWVYINAESPIIKAFYGFINQKRCKRCGHGLISKQAIFCPICGRKITWGEGKMNYNGFEVDEKGKTYRCPRCDNEDIAEEGEFCPICGVSLINKCEGHWGYYGNNEEQTSESCEALAAGNARYCIYCGGETSFYRNGFLEPWNKSPEYIQEAATTTEIDDDLPF